MEVYELLEESGAGLEGIDKGGNFGVLEGGIVGIETIKLIREILVEYTWLVAMRKQYMQWNCLYIDL